MSLPWKVQAASYAALRLLSGLLSFALFALLARWLPPHEAKPLVDFLFVTGFFLSAQKLLATQAAGITGAERRTQKLRRVFHAYGYVVCAAVVLVPVACLVLSEPGLESVGVIAAGLIILVWGLDLDLLRAVVGRDILIARVTAVGAVSALLCLVLWRDRQGALLALLLQWVPLSLLQARLAWRLRRRLMQSMQTVRRKGAGGLVALVGVSVFDGTVLNAPFFLGSWVVPGASVSIGMVTRIFSSALVLLPLVTFWSNGQLLARLGKRLGTTPPRLFWALSVASGTLAGAAFAGCYALLAGQVPRPGELLAAFVLVVGYSNFAALCRYSAHRLAAAGAALPRGLPQWLQLTVLALLNALGLCWTVTLPEPALATALLQALTLTAGGLLVAQPWRPRNATP